VVTRTGKNLLPTLTGANNNGLTSTVNADGSITISGRATGTGGYVTALTMFNRIKAGTTVTIGFGISMPQRMRCFFKNAAGSANNVTWDVNSTKSSYSNTLAKDIYGLLLYFSTTANTDYNFTIYPQLELGSTATTYESYQGQQVTIALGSTVYGGTLDVLTGTLTVTKGIIDLGGLTWDKSSSNPSVFNSTGLTDHALTTGINVICSQYPAVQANQYSISTMPDKCVKTNASYAQYIYIKNTAYESYTKEQFKTAMSGVQLVYELATPIVITGLTPAQMSTLLGVNNIWADTGATSLTYRADTKMYIDEQVSAEAKAVRSILTSVEAEMKATKNYTAGQVLIVGDDLYKATANIANGATLTVGTNVTKVTMAEWILSLV